MTHEQHLEMVKTLLEEKCFPLLARKGFEYSRSGDAQDDTLANFKRIGATLGVHPLLVWFVYAQKHWDAISTLVRETCAGRRYEASEPVEGRFVDEINYLLLGLGLVKESQDESRAGKL